MSVARDNLRSPRWSEREDNWLSIGVAGGLTAEEIAQCLPGRSPSAIIGRAWRQKLTWKYPRGRGRKAIGEAA